MRRLFALCTALLILFAACGDENKGPSTAGGQPVTLRLVTHDSFAVSDDVLAAFKKDSGIDVKVVQLGDAGVALNQAILTKKKPLGDVFFGVDNTFLSRALDADLFVPYASPGLSRVADTYELDDRHRVTPIDHGDVCVNFDKKAFAKPGAKAPATFDDLASPATKGQLVVENPATSSPGLAFLLATIAHFGNDGWQGYWRQLRVNDVQVTSGWEEAYNQAFSGGAGKGSRPLVVSYASSPAAEVHYAETPPTDAPTGVIGPTCFEQIEFAGILRGSGHQRDARRLIDFMLSDRFQRDVPLKMFVFPVVKEAALPDVFVKHAAVIAKPLRIPASDIGRNRDRWIDEWTSIVLR